MDILMCRKHVTYKCWKRASYKIVGKFPTKCFIGTNLNTTVSTVNMNFSYKMQENFLHTSVKFVSAGSNVLHTTQCKT